MNLYDVAKSRLALYRSTDNKDTTIAHLQTIGIHSAHIDFLRKVGSASYIIGFTDLAEDALLQACAHHLQRPGYYDLPLHRTGTIDFAPVRDYPSEDQLAENHNLQGVLWVFRHPADNMSRFRVYFRTTKALIAALNRPASWYSDNGRQRKVHPPP